MTQLDVPTISFAHYLDLLRRRTWHVATVSVLGLVIGGIVAMMIPRYYVANTTVSFDRPVLDAKLGTPDDPMARVVMEARHTVSRVVEKAILALKWPEGQSGSDEERRAFASSVRERIYVTDIGTKNRNRQIAELRIRYADIQGNRAAEMTNALRDLWLDTYVLGLQRRAESDLNQVMKEKTTVLADRANAARLVANFEKENRIDPQTAVGPRGTPTAVSAMMQTVSNLKVEIRLDSDAILDLESQRKHNQSMLEGTERELPIEGANRFKSPVLQRLWTELQQVILITKEKLKNCKPVHPDYKPAELMLKNAESRLAELEDVVGGGAVSTQSNPDYKRIENLLRELKRTFELRKQQREGRKDRLVRLEDRLGKLPDIYVEYGELRRKLAQLDQRDVSLNSELIDKNRAMRLIRTERPFEILQEAIVPTRPTEPNPYLQALIGCLIGLAAAIGLVIVIDFLQMTFKTVGDVESGLGLPVLGSLSYLETETEVFESRDRRAKMALFAVVVLVLSLTVVTIYYITPTRLPSVVTEFLDILLGAPN
jgi:uncharacterized protein involved in exopolysaccharide biosynthesis